MWRESSMNCNAHKQEESNANSESCDASKIDVATQTESKTIFPFCLFAFRDSFFDTLIIKNYSTASPRDIVTRLEQLKGLLDQRIKNMCKETTNNYLFKSRMINMVPVEISHEGYHKTAIKDVRNEFDQTVFQNSVPYKEIFNEATKLAEYQTRNWNDQEKRKDHNTIHGNIVGIIGLPGIGKTTLTKHIAQKTIEKSLFNDIDIFFYVQFRDINFEKNYPNLLNFLLSSSFIDWDDDPDADKEILRLLDAYCRVMIVLDGLDEAAFADLSRFSPAVTLFAEAKAETFIKGILGGKLLPKSKKILTSRSRHIYELHYDYRPRMILNILGISKPSQEMICKDICGDAYETVFNYIANNSRISSLCNNPMFCTVVAECIKKQLQQTETTNEIGSVTEIFALVIEMFICGNSKEARYISEELPELAWDAMTTNQYSFTEAYLQLKGIDQKNLNSFFNHRVDSACGLEVTRPVKTSFFIHTMLMEFLAAIKLAQKTNIETFRADLEFLKENQFESVTKFLFGLFNCKIRPCLSRIGIFTQIYNNDERIRIAKNLILKLLQDALDVKTRSSMVILWKVCSCAYEMQDDSFAREIAVQLGDKLSIVDNIHPDDIPCFCYVLKAKQSDQFELSLEPCTKFLENSYYQFFEKMFDVMKETSIVMPVVNVTRNVAGDNEITALSKCLHRISSLNLKDCQITTSQVKIIAETIKSLDTNFSEIYFSHNILDDEAARCIASCIDKIDKLHFSKSYLSENAIELLANAITKRSTPMNHFCCSGKLTGQAISFLSTCIDKIDGLILNLWYEKINVVRGIEKLCNSILKRTKPLNWLMIRNSNIGDEGLLAISKCIHNINHLKLDNSHDKNLTPFGIKELAAAFSKLETPMMSFAFGCPERYFEEAKVEFSYYDTNIKDLRIF